MTLGGEMTLVKLPLFAADQRKEIGIGIMNLTEDPELILAAMAYVEEIHKELTAENTAPPAGVADQVVQAILLDKKLSEYLRQWARRNDVLEASPTPPPRPTMDDAYYRVRFLLLASGEGAKSS
jgi:hypothetical protein